MVSYYGLLIIILNFYYASGCNRNYKSSQEDSIPDLGSANVKDSDSLKFETNEITPLEELKNEINLAKKTENDWKGKILYKIQIKYSTYTDPANAFTKLSLLEVL